MSSVEARTLQDRARISASYPWVVVGLLWMVAFMNAADRSILVAVMPRLRAQFGLSPEQLALLNSAFFWVYAFAAFLSSRLGDSSRRSWVIIGGLAFWSVATGLVSLSTGFAMLMALRGLVALGEATYYPTGTALISDWHRPEMRSRALSVHQTAVLGGTGFGAYAAGFLADRLGWQVPFVIFGAFGLVWCCVLLRWLRDSFVHDTAAAAAVRQSLLGPLRVVLRRPPALLVCLVFFFANGACTGVLVWAPTFVHDSLGLDLADSALYGAGAISFASFLGVPVGGVLADWLAVRTPLGRFYTLTIGLTLAGILLLPLALVDTALTVALVLLATSFGKGIFDGCIYAAMHDVVTREARASAVGLMTMLGFIGGGLTPIFVAVASREWGMAAGMTSLAVLYFLAVGVLLASRSITCRFVLDTRSQEEGRLT